MKAPQIILKILLHNKINKTNKKMIKIIKKVMIMMLISKMKKIPQPILMNLKREMIKKVSNKFQNKSNNNDIYFMIK